MSSGPGQRAWNRPGVGGGASAAASARWKIEQRSPGGMGGAWRRGGGFCAQGAGLTPGGGRAWRPRRPRDWGAEVSTSGARPVYFSIPPYLVCAKGVEERGKKSLQKV